MVQLRVPSRCDDRFAAADLRPAIVTALPATSIIYEKCRLFSIESIFRLYDVGFGCSDGLGMYCWEVRL